MSARDSAVSLTQRGTSLQIIWFRKPMVALKDLFESFADRAIHDVAGSQRLTEASNHSDLPPLTQTHFAHSLRDMRVRRSVDELLERFAPAVDGRLVDGPLITRVVEARVQA